MAATELFSYVEERDEFLSLFPHRFDYIYAEHPQPKESPNWQTERRYPLSDRLIQQGHALYGVRFGTQTRYCLLDIDAGSPYHPQQDEQAIARIAGVLEAIGLVGYVACTSSYSGGLHLYFPFPDAQSSWELAAAVSALLENAGFIPKAGQLEIFPNPKPYAIEGKPNLFNAHRLPLQAGSYLLDRYFQPVWGTQREFVQQWRSIESRNVVDRLVLKRILKQARRRRFCISGKADKFINDLNAEIELGWTGAGQTNRLLGRIAMRAYIFHHIIAGGVPLTGETLVQEIVRTAVSLPGYQDWCNHQHEIEQRAEEWARCIESSRYFHYGASQGKYKTKAEESSTETAETAVVLPTWNQQQTAAARERIRLALIDLLEQNSLPASPTARFRALCVYGIGGGSLYRHRDLWHPAHIEEQIVDQTQINQTKQATADLPVENPPDPPSLLVDCPIDCVSSASIGQSPTSLFPKVGGNLLTDERLSDRTATAVSKAGGNSGQASSRTRAPALLPTWRSLPAVPVSISSLAEMAIEQDGSPQDWSDLLVVISVEIRRLGWTRQQANDRLFHLFGKRQQAMLTEAELWDWLKVLNGLPGLGSASGGDRLAAIPTANCKDAPAAPLVLPDKPIVLHLPIEKWNPPD